MSNNEMKQDMSCDTTRLYSKENQPILGKYGRMRRTFLQEHCKTQYNLMLMNDTLWSHLREIDEQAQSTVNAIIARMAEIDGVTEELKATDPMRWIGLMNNYRHCAEELVIREIVY